MKKKRFTLYLIAGVLSCASFSAFADADVEKESHCKQMADAYRFAYPLSEQLTPKEIIQRIQQRFPKITYSENTHVVHSALVDVKEAKLKEAKAEKERAEKEAAEREKAEKEAAEKAEQELVASENNTLKTDKKKTESNPVEKKTEKIKEEPKEIKEEVKEEVKEEPKEKIDPIDAKAKEIFDHCMKEENRLFGIF